MLGLDRSKPLSEPRFDGNPPHIAIISAHYFPDVSNALTTQVKNRLKQIFAESDLIEVPGVLELPAALRLAILSERYEGFVVLGAMIDGDAGEDVMFQEALRAIIAIAGEGAAVGTGLIWAESKKKLGKITAKRGDLGGSAATAALHLVDLARRISLTPAASAPVPAPAPEPQLESPTFRPESEHIIVADNPKQSDIV